MSKQDNAQIYEMLSVLFLTVSKGEQAQQCIRQVFTSHPLFAPLPLFKYLTQNATVLKPQHLLHFLQQNNEQTTEEEIKIIMEYQPGKKQWQYTDFLEFVYPFNSAVLREINNMHLKRYPKLERYAVPQSALAGFLLLLTEHIALIRKLQTQKSDSLLKISREKLRKVLLSIKKAGDKQPSHCQNDKSIITSLELRNFMKAFVSVQDSHFLYLSRRLGIKNGFFPIEQLQKFIKLNKKTPKKSLQGKKNQKQKPQLILDNSFQKQFDEKQYKQQILEQLANTLNLKQSRKRSPALKSVDQNVPLKNITFKPAFQAIPKQGNSTNRSHPGDNYFADNGKEDRSSSSSSPKELLLKFIQTFLPASRRLEELKLKLSQHRLDYFKLFKIIDRESRGVAGAQDLLQYYQWAGGRIHYSLRDFDLLIERYSQSDEPWITLTEFCQMVRGQDKEGSGRSAPKLEEQHQQLVIKIIEITLESEKQILTIRNQFRKHESKYLFNLINREQTGFINYQELKRFLCDSGLQLSMHDLMCVLKRLDRSRNGVVVEHQFVSYFQPTEGFSV